MTSTDSLDDGWAELARELNLPEPEPARPKPDTSPGVLSPSEATHGTPDPEFAEPTDEVSDAPFGADDDADLEPGTDDPSEDTIPEGATAEGEKKRRRRRRRRKKGSGESVEPASTSAEIAATDDDADSSDGYEDEAPPVVDATDETTPEMAREIIATWNVPSWDEIVAGLHRPDR